MKAYFLGHFPPYLAVYSALQWPVIFIVVFKGFNQRRGLRYFLELCWIINIVGWFCMAVEILCVLGYIAPLLSEDSRNRIGYSFFVMINGPLAAAVLMNSNALVLHDIVKTSGVFIHLSPAIVSYSLRWRPIWTSNLSWAPFDKNGGFFASTTPARHNPKSFSDAIV